MGNAELRVYFSASKKTHEISVTTTQMALLCLFNTGDRLTFTEILSALSVTMTDSSMIERDLLAMSCAKYRILTKEPKSKRISATDVFSFAEDFSCKLYKFKIGTVAVQEDNVQRERTHVKADEDRSLKIDAAVVRIMKSRKLLDHANLVAEVTKQLAARFTASPQMIKKQIEKLIEREYLERDATDRKLYKYLA
jgi:cullin 3